MTFETWAKELLCKELKDQGTTIYVRKPKHLQGWYCATPSGFLLHVEAEKTRFGYFRINYEIMPLIGRFFDPTDAVPVVPYVSMGMNTDVAWDYIRKFDYPADHDCKSLRTHSIGESATDDTVVAMVRNYLNPLFESLTSYENYCKGAMEIYPFYNEIKEVSKRKELSQMLFDCGLSAGISRPAYYRDNFPMDYPWYTLRINQMPYVYALLGKYEEALAQIRGIREVRLRLQSAEYTHEQCPYTEDVYLEQVQLIKNRCREIEEAMQKKDIVRIRNILEANYQRNRELIYKLLGLKIPETCSVL